MTLEELLHRMEQDLQLRGMSKSTQFNYLRAVRKYSEYFQKAPDQITEEELRDYFVYLKNVKHFSRSASTQVIAAFAGTSVRHQVFLHLHSGKRMADVQADAFTA